MEQRLQDCDPPYWPLARHRERLPRYLFDFIIVHYVAWRCLIFVSNMCAVAFTAHSDWFVSTGFGNHVLASQPLHVRCVSSDFN